MDLSKTLYSLLGVLVSVIIIATLAVPVVSNASTPTVETVKAPLDVEQPIYYSTDMNVSEDYVLEYNRSEKTISYGDSQIILTEGMPIIISDTYCAFYNGSNIYEWVVGPGYNTIIDTDFSFKVASLMDCHSMSWIVYLSPTGDYVTSGTANQTVLIDALDVYSCYVRSGSTASAVFIIKDGVQLTDPASSEYPFTFQYTETDGKYKIDYLKATLESPVPQSSFLIIPGYIETVVYHDAPYGAILNVVLLMLFIVPVITVAAMLYTRRD